MVKTRGLGVQGSSYRGEALPNSKPLVQNRILVCSSPRQRSGYTEKPSLPLSHAGQGWGATGELAVEQVRKMAI